MAEFDLILMSLCIFLPSLFALVLLFFPRGTEEYMRWWTLFGTAATLVISLFLFVDYLKMLDINFDETSSEKSELRVRHAIPYSDLTSITEAERQEYARKGEPLNFGHTLEDQIGGQLDAGFALTGFYEDGDPAYPLARYLPVFIATRAVKLARAIT